MDENTDEDEALALLATNLVRNPLTGTDLLGRIPALTYCRLSLFMIFLTPHSSFSILQLEYPNCLSLSYKIIPQSMICVLKIEF